MGRPPELIEMEMVDAMAQRYGKFPREVLHELECDPSLLRNVLLVVDAPRDKVD